MIILNTRMETGTVFKEGAEGDRLPEYQGSYKVTPKIEKITLPTKDKSLYEDITVYQIPYSAVKNNAGGNTITIGLE